MTPDRQTDPATLAPALPAPATQALGTAGPASTVSPATTSVTTWPATSQPAVSTHALAAHVARDPARRAGSRSRRTRARVAIGAVLLAVLAGSMLFPSAGPAAALPAPDRGVTVLPCEDGGWGVCDTRATDRGYEYRYQAGRFVPAPVGPRANTAPADCTDNCPPDPASVCDLLLAVGPDPTMSAAALADYNEQVAACQVWLADNDAVPLADVEAQLADYLREGIVSDPSVTVQPTGRSFANLPTLFYTPVPDTFILNVNQPVLATITAEPRYHWDFGDGEVGPNAPGRPYDPAISPREHPEAYVSHGYDKPGTYQVTLTVTWIGSFTVPGVPQSFPLPPVELAAADDVAVQESVGVLTGND